MNYLTRFLLACLCLWSVAAGAAQLKSGVFDPPRAAPEFALPGSDDNLFELKHTRGKLVILGFGFSHCPEICPTTLATLGRTLKILGATAAQVQVVYVTVDPERDTPARLREYLRHFHPNFIGLSGTAEALAAVRRDYGILAAKEVHGDGNYEVHHSSYLYLIDRQGLLRALVPYGKTAADIAHDVESLLQEPWGQANQPSPKATPAAAP